ncbi:MAG: PAS domain-containing protein [Cyanobacteria bacterium J055]|nr:MAG: PAS domain-containing protein [Cyanobacteria bacterium J055]
MTLMMFLLGLAVGMGLVLWQQIGLRQRLQQSISELHSSLPDDVLSLWSQLRRGIVLAKRREQELEAALAAWQQLLDIAPFGYLQVDDENQLLWCNRQAQSLLRIDRPDPDRPRLLLKWVRSYELDRLIELARDRQQPTEREWVFHSMPPDVEKPEPDRAVALRGYAVPLPEGEVGVFLENRQAMVELTQSRDRWLSDLTHELRTPLTSIRLVAEALQTRVEPQLESWVERLLREVNRITQFVDDWLELSQIDTSTSHRLNYRSIELERLVQSVWQTLEPLANPKSIGLVYQASEPFELEADESRLFRLFLNLLNNSTRYSPENSAIWVKVSPAKGGICIDVIDSGTGFAESDLPRVFDRFYRGDPSRQRQSAATPVPSESTSNGSGLGLAIVRRIARAHGGSVTANNHPETGGAWMQIYLPRRNPHVEKV